MKQLDINKKEKKGWMMITEKSMKEIWDNDKDNQIWIKYIIDENN